MENKTLCSLLALGLLACSSPRAQAPAKLVRQPAVAVSPDALERRDPLPLAERLAHEASDQPEARQRVEASLTALREAGVSLTRTRQVLARPLAAQYCASALTAGGLGLALCAFSDVRQAEHGRALSQASFDGLIPGRTMLVKEAELLTFTRAGTAEASAEARQVRAVFAAKPSHPRL